MRICYKNIDIDIYAEGNKIDFDLNRDIDIDSIRFMFNERIASLSLKNDSIAYWTLRISERNTLIHNLFLDICRIELVKTYIKKKKNITIYTNNISIFLFFRKEAKITFNSFFLFLITKTLVRFKPYGGLVKYIIKKTVFNIRFKNKYNIKNLSNHIIIQTWVSDVNFTGGNFKDAYYGNLVAFLKKQNKNVITWPIFYNVKNINYAISFLRKNHQDFLMMEDYLTPLDYLVSIKHFFLKRFINLGQVVINKNDYTSVFNFYKKKECVEEASLMYSFTKRLKKNNIENITFLINHENMIFEKGIILGVRTFLKNSKVIGCFHTTKPRNLLCLDYASVAESIIAPKPDFILFNSDVYKNYYQKKYPKIISKNGIAFKQLYLNNLPAQKIKIRNSNVLVIFSGTISEIKLMCSLISKIPGKHNFLFRMHPMNQFKVESLYDQKNYKLVNENKIEELLLISNKVLSTYSSLSLEMAVQGNNIGLVYDKQKLLLNPFDETGIKNYSLISNTNELVSFLKKENKKETKASFFNIENEFYKIFLEVI